MKLKLPFIAKICGILVVSLIGLNLLLSILLHFIDFQYIFIKYIFIPKDLIAVIVTLALALFMGVGAVLHYKKPLILIPFVIYTVSLLLETIVILIDGVIKGMLVSNTLEYSSSVGSIFSIVTVFGYISTFFSVVALVFLGFTFSCNIYNKIACFGLAGCMLLSSLVSSIIRYLTVEFDLSNVLSLGFSYCNSIVLIALWALFFFTIRKTED